MYGDRQVYASLSHAHVSLHVLYARTHMYSGRQAVQLPVWLRDAQLAVVGEVPGHGGCAGSGTGECLRSCVLSSCTANAEGGVLQVLCVLRALCGSIPVHAEDTELAMG